MGKHRKTKENDNLTKWNNWYSEDRDGYRKFAESKREHNRFNQEALTQIYDGMRAYAIEKQTTCKPMTIGGLQISAGCNKMDFSRMRNREYDWRKYQFMHYNGITEADVTINHDDLLNLDILYWMDEDGALWILNTFSEIIESFYLLIQEQLEMLCYTSGNPRGAIFLLKSVFGWTEDRPQEHQTFTGNIHVASKKEAEQALKEYTSSE